MTEKSTKKKRSLFNMEVDAKFKEAVKQLRHLDPNVPSAREVVLAAVYEKLNRALEDARRTGVRR